MDHGLMFSIRKIQILPYFYRYFRGFVLSDLPNMNILTLFSLITLYLSKLLFLEILGLFQRSYFQSEFRKVFI